MRTLISRAEPRAEDLARLYETMLRIRRFEEAAAALWADGEISGEFHSSIGEEAVAAGVIDHLREGDAIAADHRSSGPFVARGVPLAPLFHELQGHEEGLCGGMAGHMHLMSKEHLIVSDGIVGASGPLACGLAMPGRGRRDGRLAVALFGEGAINQGMLLESFNLAVVWRLPVLFVCKDSRWSISTRSSDVTGGGVDARARGFGLRVIRADGADVADVWSAVRRVLPAVRQGRPTFLHVDVRRPDGHLLDDAFLRPLRSPVSQARELGGPLVRALRRPGGGGLATLRGLGHLVRRFAFLARDRAVDHDPLRSAARRLDPVTVGEIDQRVTAAVQAALTTSREVEHAGA